MQHELGGLYASQDADSEGEEGKFYVWTPSELRDILGDDDAGTRRVQVRDSISGAQIITIDYP